MRRLSIAFLAALLVATATHAADKPAPASPKGKTCAKGELGGIVATNKKVGKEFVTTIKGDKTPLRTPEAAGDIYTTVSKLQPGDLYCFKDEGS